MTAPPVGPSSEPLLQNIASRWENGTSLRHHPILDRIEDGGSRRRGAVESQCWTRFDGRVHVGGAVWRRGDVDGRWDWQDLCNDSS